VLVGEEVEVEVGEGEGERGRLGMVKWGGGGDGRCGRMRDEVAGRRLARGAGVGIDWLEEW
jgi:hypothetical protein